MSTQNSAVEIQFPLHAIPHGSRTGSPDAPCAGNGHLPRVTQVMALAIHFQDTIQRGEARDYADLARLGCVSRERISQIMELVWLAPDIQQALLSLPTVPTGRYPINESAIRKIANLLSWSNQREQWRQLKQAP